MFKKIISSLIAVAILVAMLVVPVGAETVIPAGEDFTIAASKVYPFKTGDEVRVRLTLTGITSEIGLLGIDLEIKYNSGMLSPELQKVSSSFADIEKTDPELQWELLTTISDSDESNPILRITGLNDSSTYKGFAENDVLWIDLVFTALTDGEVGEEIFYTPLVEGTFATGELDKAYGTGCSVEVVAAPDSITSISGDFEYISYGSYGMITAYKGTDSVVTVPAEIDGIPITGIGSEVFSGNSTITTIYIEEGITSIGTKAFYNCTSLEAVIFPESMATIRENAFLGCPTDMIIYYYGTYDDYRNKIQVFSEGNSDVLPYCLYFLHDPNIGFVIGINTTGNELFDFAFSGEECILLRNGEICESSEKIRTGDVVLAINSMTSLPYARFLSVAGDVNGDGKITTIDYMLVKRAVTNPELLEGHTFFAADVKSDGRINSTDYLRIKRSFSSNYDLYANLYS